MTEQDNPLKTSIEKITPFKMKYDVIELLRGNEKKLTIFRTFFPLKGCTPEN
jgi:hypothetical protein